MDEEIKEVLKLITENYEQADAGNATVKLSSNEIAIKVASTGVAEHIDAATVYKMMVELGFKIGIDKDPDNFELRWMLKAK